MNISTPERLKYKKALIRAEQPTAGLSDQELVDAYNKIAGNAENNQAATFDSEAAKQMGVEPVKVEPTIIDMREVDDATVKEVLKVVTKPAKNKDSTQQNAEHLVACLQALMPEQVTKSAPVDKDEIIDLIREYSTTPRPIEVIQRNKGTSSIIDTPHKVFEDVLLMASCGLNVYCYGPAGSGKTTLAQQIANALSLDFHYTGAILQKYELLGFIDAGGDYQTTPFRQAYENGGVFLFDELDASLAGALVAFNAALDNGLCAFPDGVITKHADFVCLATANTMGKGATRQYLGRNPLDGATLDRYQFVELKYDQEIETVKAMELYKQMGGESESEVLEILTRVRSLRGKADELKMTCIISPRASFGAAKMVGAGMDIDQALKHSLYNKLSVDERAQLGVK